MKKIKPVYQFVVHGRPQPKQRPRKGKYGNFYTPQKTKDYEEKIHLSFRELYPKFGDAKHKWLLKIDVYVCDSWTGDIDNLTKSVSDGLQLLLFTDDRQVWDVHTIRHKAHNKKFECIIIYAEPMGEL